MSVDQSCTVWQAQLSAYADGELSTTDSLAVAQHVTGCKACAREFNDLLLAMKTIREQMPSLKAPNALRARVLADLARADFAAPARGAPRASARWNGWLVAATLVLVAGSGYLAGTRMAAPRTQSVDDAVLAAHVRSLQPGHLTDVSSTDQHAVKPWFTGKLDFSPSVARLDSSGFLLVGGRLDYLENRAVAALVYRRRSHLINVLSYPATRPGDVAPHLESKNGFQIANWSGRGIMYWVVSDLNAEELRGFCALLRERIATQ